MNTLDTLATKCCILFVFIISQFSHEGHKILVMAAIDFASRSALGMAGVYARVNVCDALFSLYLLGVFYLNDQKRYPIKLFSPFLAEWLMLLTAQNLRLYFL